MCISSFSEITRQNNAYLLIKKYFGSKDTNYRSDSEVKWTPSLKVSHLFPGRKLFLSHKGKSEENPMGPLDSLSILLVSMNLIWVFKNTWYILLFSYLENLYHAKGRGRYERTPYGVHFAVFPFYMPLVNENLDFKITNIKTRFFTKTGHKFVFLCKNMLKILYETRMRTVKFHKTR